jgi:hypothetical protein
MKIRWARSATRHRISKKRSRYVIEHYRVSFELDAPVDAPAKQTRQVYLGDDAEGVPLEVMAVVIQDDNLLVIHAMPLRRRFVKQYEEA